MAAAHLPRSRSPVMSIRTQPDEENSLRAEIEAAKRTQHEILPRYSWHTNTRRDSSSNLKQVYPPISQRDRVLQRSAKPSTQCDEPDFDDPFAHSTNLCDAEAQYLPGSDAKPHWRQFTRRRVRTELANILPGKVLSIKRTDKASQRGSKSQRMSSKNTETVADGDRAAQQAQFQAWLAEKFAERGHPPQASDLSAKKTKTSLRRSIGGFRVASKNPLEKLRNRTSSTSSFTPHLYSFETKDHLHAYLNQNDVMSPISPAGDGPRLASTLKDIELAELSAGPLPAELEGTAPKVSEQVQFPMSRTSTPDVRDLPPYVDDKRFVNDMVKEQAEERDMSRINSLDDSLAMPTASYFCSTCERNITGEDIYDFCSMCDTKDRVTCHSCAQRGHRCRHEVELLSLPSADAARDEAWTGSNSKDPLRSSCPHSCSEANAHLGNLPRSPARMIADSDLSAHRPRPREDTRCVQTLEENQNSLHFDFLQHMTQLRHENEFDLRERELAIRSREIDVRDQQVTLREREALVQQKSDALMRNLETLVSYQQLAKSAFIGAQFQPHRNQDLGDESSTLKPQPEVPVLNHEHQNTYRAAGNEYQTKRCAAVTQVVAQLEESIQGLDHDSSHIRSRAAQKRKKDSRGSGSVNSTPTAASSPEHHRKTSSGGGSERNESPDEDDEDEGNRFPKKNKQESSSPNGQQLLFACPFSKFNPQRFSSRNTAEKNYRGCSTHYLPDVSRLKQHLKRVHWQPETYCPRCFEEYSNAAQLVEHAQANVACVARDCPFPEKMDRTQQEKIHVKRPRVPPETVWYDIYKVLFPHSQPPDSPYMEGDDRIITPLSATPPSAVNVQAIQMLSAIFNQKLNQQEELRNHPLREIINNSLTESMTELLDSFSLSPTHSPIGGGPSIVVSPVSRSPSSRTLAPESPTSAPFQRPQNRRKRSMTNVVSQPPTVPMLQHPRPKARLEAALRVPPDHHRSSSVHARHDSVSHGSPADVIFDINIPVNVTDDPGYDNESRSFEQGDDQNAMAFVVEPTPVPLRNKSVVSLDSGYGSGKSQRASEMQPSIPQHPVNTDTPRGQLVIPREGYRESRCTSVPDFPSMDPLALAASQLSQSHDAQNEDAFDYAHYLDQSDQELFRDGGYAFGGQHNPWSYP